VPSSVAIVVPPVVLLHTGIIYCSEESDHTPGTSLASDLIRQRGTGEAALG